MAVECREIEYGSDEYMETVNLRSAVLRVPLGLEFSETELAEESGSRHIAAYVDGRITACLVLKPETNRLVRMRQLAVAPAMQRHGIGSALVAYAERVAAGLGFAEIILDARETAVSFYERLGYRKEGRPFVKINLSHVAMKKRLDAAVK